MYIYKYISGTRLLTLRLQISVLAVLGGESVVREKCTSPQRARTHFHGTPSDLGRIVFVLYTNPIICTN